MRAFVRSAVFGLALVAAAGSSAPASAGGAVLSFRREHYVTGDVAVGRVSFGRGSVGLHMLDRGPFYAYLVPAGRWIDPPRVPARAVPLGPMRIVPLGDPCGGPCYLATVRFTVPDVPSGLYGISYCNDPCTVAGVGELVGGGITIYGSDEEARFERTLDRLRERVNAVGSSRRTLKRRFEARSHELELALDDTRDKSASLSERIGVLREQLAAARNDAERFDPLSALGWLLFGVTIVARARARRRPKPMRPRPLREPSLEPPMRRLARAAPKDHTLEPVP